MIAQPKNFMIVVIIISLLIVIISIYTYVIYVAGSGSKLSPNVDFSSPAGRHFTTPNNCVTPGSGTSSGHPNNHDCHTPHCPARGLTSPWPLQTPHHHIGVRPGVSLEERDSIKIFGYLFLNLQAVGDQVTFCEKQFYL